MTRKDVFPLPHIDDLLDQLSSWKVFQLLMHVQAIGRSRSVEEHIGHLQHAGV